MTRVPKESLGQWTRDYCGITRCWAARSTCYKRGEARGHTEESKRHYRNMAREAREEGASNSSVPVAPSCSSPPWAAKAPPPRSVPPRASSTAPWASSKPLSEVDKVHDSDQTALLRAALALFENCDFPPGILGEIRKIVPPHRSPTRKAPKVFRQQVVLNMKKKLEKEEQELRERTSALDQDRKLVRERQQKAMDQAIRTLPTILRLKYRRMRMLMQLLWEFLWLLLRLFLGPFLLRTLLWTPRVTTWMIIFSKRPILLLQNVKESSVPFKFLRTNKSAQQWTAGLDRESVREGLLHFQALHEQHEREEHARQAEAM